MSLDIRERSKVNKYIEFLRSRHGYLDEPYAKHIIGKIRELRIDFARHRHRIFYCLFENKNIILLSAFIKKIGKTPEAEIKKALLHYENILNNQSRYE